MKHTWTIPTTADQGSASSLSINNEVPIFIVGANGSGKSALITHFSKTGPQNSIVRIAAHRQSWLHSSSADLTAKQRQDIQRNIQNKDRSDESRWKDDYANPRAQAALFDLGNSQNKVDRQIADLLRQKNEEEAKLLASAPSPIELVNDILRISTLSLTLSIHENGDVQASHPDGQEFSVTMLSDGERNAVLIAAQVLTAPEGTIFLIDEPERHLHRSITEPMLGALFEKREDCSFVIATHEPELPACNPDARVIITRGCNWSGNIAQSWDLDVLEPDVEIPNEIRKAILGSRRAILFVEGDVQSLDYPLYSALFPEISVSPKGSCTDVEKAVKGLSESDDLHWVQPIGLIDRDDRSDDDVEELQDQKVFALDVSSIESVFYSTTAIQAIASVQAEIYDSEEISLSAAVSAAFGVLNEDTKTSLAARRSQKSARNEVLSKLPEWKVIKENRGATISIDIETAFDDELEKLNAALQQMDLDALTSRYVIKKTGVPLAIASSLRFRDKRHYEEAVVSLVKRDEGFRNELRGILGPITTHLESQPEE